MIIRCTLILPLQNFFHPPKSSLGSNVSNINAINIKCSAHHTHKCTCNWKPWFPTTWTKPRELWASGFLLHCSLEFIALICDISIQSFFKPQLYAGMASEIGQVKHRLRVPNIVPNAPSGMDTGWHRGPTAALCSRNPKRMPPVLVPLLMQNQKLSFVLLSENNSFL